MLALIWGGQYIQLAGVARGLNFLWGWRGMVKKSGGRWAIFGGF